jgi:phosphoglycerate dehydrogenase-like enzyme
MTIQHRPTLLLSAHFAAQFADELAAISPDAAVIRHAPDNSYDADPAAATVAFVSHDMWFSRNGRDVLKLLPELPALRWVHTSSAGIDDRPFLRLLERGVILTNASGVNGVIIAQHVLALMLAHARRLDEYRAFQAERHWERLLCAELTGATVLVAGLGGIGSEVARLCRAFGMTVLGTRRSGAPAPNVDRVLPPEAFHDALPDADFVVIACPLTETTRGLIDAGALARMKASAYLVNVARGPIVDAAALDAALRQGRIAGAAMDVFDREPLAADSPLWTTPNLTITPHSAGSSPLNPVRNARFFLANLARYLRGEPLQNLVTSAE